MHEKKWLRDLHIQHEMFHAAEAKAYVDRTFEAKDGKDGKKSLSVIIDGADQATSQKLQGCYRRI
jgi:hypothetical protein